MEKNDTVFAAFYPSILFSTFSSQSSGGSCKRRKQSLRRKCLRRVYFLVSLCMLWVVTGHAQKVTYHSKDTTSEGGDSAKIAGMYTLGSRDSVGYFPYAELYLKHTGAISSVDMAGVRDLPYTSVNQMLAARATGVDVRIPSDEPAKRNSVFIRGTSSLLLNNSDIFYAQPTYVVDGIPLIMDHPFAYDIQRFDFNRLGTEADLLSFLNVNDIQSIEVLKDFAASAKYGPNAANGIINITTKGPRTGEMIVSVNSYLGYSLRPHPHVINAQWERNFRLPFYQKYANTQDYENFPKYLGDSTQPNYFGPANWDDIYYQNGLSDGIQAGVSGGTQLATFRFSLGKAGQQGVADRTGMNRYDVNFGINIIPYRNLILTTYVQAATMTRDRNHSIQSRIGDEDYVLNLETPPSPNKSIFKQYYDDLGNGIDKNKNNSVRLLANLRYQFLNDHLVFNSRFGIDYGQNFRSLFIPSTLSDGNNFVSDFDGLNRLLVLDNSLAYTTTFSENNHISVTFGQYDQWMKWRYDYGRAYKGSNDYIKIYAPGDDANHQGVSNNLRLQSNFKDYTSANLASFYGNVDYNYQGKYFLSLYLREDGSSNVSTTNRWLFSPTISGSWRASQEDFLKGSHLISSLNVRASWGKVGRMIMDEYYKDGPIYNVDVGWDGTPDIATYDAFPALNASFGTGYIPNGVSWPYVTQYDAGVDVGVFKDRLRVSLDAYSKVDHNQLLKIPTMEEQGYTGIIENGLKVNNYGFEADVNADIIRGSKFQWSSGLSVYTNQNKLLALPGGLQNMILDNRRFLVGKPTDRYWVLVNQGIYQSDNDVPKNPATGKPMTYEGIPLKAGDPKWKDLNGDYVINDQDREMKGRLSPALTGGFSNQFSYKGFELNVLVAYALDRKVINQALADRFNFVNREGVDDPSGIKEVTFWAIVPGDYQKIPEYNPWSDVSPYQANQTLFLEDASYLKIRSVTLAYNLHGKWMQRAGINQFRIYATGNNLYTWTDYTGGDPEAIDYFGYDQGFYNWPAPIEFTVGFNFQF